MEKAHILLIEGRRAGENSLAPSILKVGFRVTTCHTADEALKAFSRHEPDLIIFDAATMRSNGIRTCHRLRRKNEAVPIIHCRDEGEAEPSPPVAEVHLAQPFSARKLLNRVRALLPADPEREEIVRVADIVYFRTKRSVFQARFGERRLTPKLAELLEQFLRHPDVVLNRRFLMEAVWNTSYVGDTRTLDVHIRWMRELIEADPANPLLVRTVRGEGYVFRPAGETNDADGESAP